MQKTVSLILTCLVLILGTVIAARADVIDPGLKEILQSLGSDEEIAIIVELAETVDLNKFKDKNKALRRSKIIRALQQKAEKTQKNIKKYLKQSRVKKVKSFWIFNGLAVTANAKVIKKMAGMAGIVSIRPDSTLTLEEPRISVNAGVPEWNIDAINVPELWSMGYTGSGIVLASMDTGVDVNHQDLVSRWRGGSNSWYDPNGEHATPYDGDTWGHGTTVMGVMVGGHAGDSAIGVAPGAQWISVKIFNDARVTSDSVIYDGFQWILDPDANPDTDDAPDVVNNSWGYPYYAGCYRLSYFQPVIQALKASGIGVVFSAGNDGINGASTGESMANYPDSIGVGAVDSTQTIASFSSRGPSACDGGTFPALVAPGVNIRSADLGNSYAYVSGTSIAAAHVTGAMGLLLNAYPSLSIDEIESAFAASASDLGVSGPDDTYGYGLLNVLGAYDLLSRNLAQAPIANNDIFTIPRNITAIIDILDLLGNDIARDFPIDVNSLVLRSALTVRGNFVTVNVDNTITYTPEGGGGPDYFWYTVNDVWGATSNEARVRINRVRGVEPVPTSAVTPSPGGVRIKRQ